MPPSGAQMIENAASSLEKEGIARSSKKLKVFNRRAIGRIITEITRSTSEIGEPWRSMSGTWSP